MKKKIIAWAAIVVIIVILAVSLISRFAHKEEPDVAMKPVVSVAAPEVRTIELSSDLIGTVEPSSIVYVKPKAGGELVSLNVKTGDRVEAGQLLCVIDTKQVESARLSMESARVSMNTAQDALNRLQVLYASGDVSEQEYTQTRNNADAARLQYESASEAYRIQMDNANVTAPISGVVENCTVELHDVLSTDDQICVISEEGQRTVTFYVSDKVIQGIHLGDALEVDKNGSIYPAAVVEVSSMIDPDTGLFKVKAVVNDQGALPTGSSVKLSVISERADNVLTIPVDAVYYEQGNPFVYTYDNGVVHKVSVETGLYDSEYMEIRGGLNAADQVIVTWTSELFEGSAVNLAGGSDASEAAEGQEAEAQAETETTQTDER